MSQSPSVATTTTRSTERILTTHTGSLPRPEVLLNMLAAREAGEAVSDRAFDERVRDAVAESVANQVASGLDIVNDGEQGRYDFVSYAKYRLTGYEDSVTPFKGLSGADVDDFPEFKERRNAPQLENKLVPLCDSPVTYRGDAVRTDLTNLADAAALSGASATFMTSVGPGELSVFLPNGYYATHEEYLEALANAMREEYEAIYAAGHLVQVDAPDLGLGFHIYYRGSTVEEYRRKISLHVEAINAATANIPPEAMRMHVCYGPEASPHNHDVEFRDVVDIALKARPAGLTFEAANCRHEHDYHVFEDVRLPDGKYLIPGVIDVTTNRIEHPALIAERIVRLARLVGRENVVAGTDCGFATLSQMRDIMPSVVWAKLRALAEGAQLASAELW